VSGHATTDAVERPGRGAAAGGDDRPPLLVRWLGRVGYAAGVALQAELVAAVRDGSCPDTLLLLEHEPVVTIGRGGSPAHVLLDAAEFAARGIELHEAGRGGDVTYHGPGQLVGYPVIALRAEERDAHRYLRDLEEVLIRAVAGFGLQGKRVSGLTGVWLGDEKLAAIGVRLSTGWITGHGFALNVEARLSGFETIVPCGIHGRGVTSLGHRLGTAPALADVAARVARCFAEVFDREPTLPAEPAERLGMPGAPTLSWKRGPGDGPDEETR
jgi:lipoyl(octanoyl) transferase